MKKSLPGCRESQINGTETRAKQIKKDLRETMRVCLSSGPSFGLKGILEKSCSDE